MYDQVAFGEPRFQFRDDDTPPEPLNPSRGLRDFEGCMIEAHPAAPDNTIFTLPQVIPYRRSPAMGRWRDNPWDSPSEETIERIDIPQETMRCPRHERVEIGVRNFIREMRNRLGRNVDFTLIMSLRTLDRLLRELERSGGWRDSPGMRAAVEAVRTPWKDYVMKKEGLMFEDQMDAALTAFAEGAA